MGFISEKEERRGRMNDKIAVFTNSDNLFHVISKSVQGTSVDPVKFQNDQYEKAAEIKFIMGIVDFEKTENDYDNFMRIFNIKYRINKPILACIYEENPRYVLNLLTFGVEDYIKKPFRRNEIKNKIENIMRYQKWLEEHGAKIMS